MAQLSYTNTAERGFPGMLSDSGFLDTRSYVNADAAAMPFGIAVGQGTTEQTCILLADANTKIVGVTEHTHAVDPNNTTTGIPIKGTVGALRRGRIYVLVEAAVAAGDAVFARHTANGPLTQKGAFRNDADTANAVAMANCKFTSPSFTYTDPAGTALLCAEIDCNIP